MAVFVVIVALCLALTVVQIDKFVARNQPLAILPAVMGKRKTAPKDCPTFPIIYNLEIRAFKHSL